MCAYKGTEGRRCPAAIPGMPTGARSQEGPRGRKGHGARTRAARRRDAAAPQWPKRHLVGTKTLQCPEPSRIAQVVEKRPERPRTASPEPQKGTEGRRCPVAIPGMLTGARSQEGPGGQKGQGAGSPPGSPVLDNPGCVSAGLHTKAPGQPHIPSEVPDTRTDTEASNSSKRARDHESHGPRRPLATPPL